MDHTQHRGGGLVGVLGKLFHRVEDPHSELSSDAVKNYLKYKRKELKEIIDETAKGEFHDASENVLRRELKGYLDSLKARKDKDYKDWDDKIKRLDEYS